MEIYHAAYSVNGAQICRGEWRRNDAGRMILAVDFSMASERDPSMDEQLVDQIYESAFVPELWPSVLERLAHIAGAQVGWLFVSSRGLHRASCSHAPTLNEFGPLIESGWYSTDPRAAAFFKAIATYKCGFLREIDIWSAEEFETQLKTIPVYRDILVPRGYGMVAGAAFEAPTADRVYVSMERKFAHGPVEDEAIAQLDALRPHLGRSAAMAARLQLERARSAAETLARLGLPALVVDHASKVLSANSLVEQLPGYVSWRARNLVSLEDKAAEKLLTEALATIGEENPSVRSFPVRHNGCGNPMIAHVVPIRLSARDIFVQATAAVILMPVALRDAPPVELIQTLFDLTPAEARVARSLAAGNTLDAIATDSGVSYNTVRSQVRRVLEKTGSKRQTDVVALLTSIGSPRAPSS